MEVVLVCIETDFREIEEMQLTMMFVITIGWHVQVWHDAEWHDICEVCTGCGLTRDIIQVATTLCLWSRHLGRLGIDRCVENGAKGYLPIFLAETLGSDIVPHLSQMQKL